MLTPESSDPKLNSTGGHLQNEYSPFFKQELKILEKRMLGPLEAPSKQCGLRRGNLSTVTLF